MRDEWTTVPAESRPKFLTASIVSALAAVTVWLVTALVLHATLAEAGVVLGFVAAILCLPLLLLRALFPARWSNHVVATALQTTQPFDDVVLSLRHATTACSLRPVDEREADDAWRYEGETAWSLIGPESVRISARPSHDRVRVVVCVWLPKGVVLQFGRTRRIMCRIVAASDLAITKKETVRGNAATRYRDDIRVGARLEGGGEVGDGVDG